MKLFLFIILAVTNANLLAMKSNQNCNIYFEKVNLCAKVEFIEKLEVNKNNKINFTFYNYNSYVDEVNEEPILIEKIEESFRFDIYTYMIMDNGHHHKGLPFTWGKSDDYTIHSSNVKFFTGMKGYWQIRVELNNLIHVPMGDMGILDIEL